MKVLDYLLNLIIFGQCLFFMYMYEYSCRNLPLKPKAFFLDGVIRSFFYSIAIIFTGIMFISGYNFQRYNTYLIIQYVFLVIYAFRVLYKLKCQAIKSISLAFLLVFLNSYIWECILHFAEYTINPMMLLNFRETIHLIVLPFLFCHYNIDKKSVIRQMYVLIFINFLFSLLTIDVYHSIYAWRISIPFFNNLTGLTHFLNRIISLTLLLDIFINDATEKQERKWWF